MLRRAGALTKPDPAACASGSRQSRRGWPLLMIAALMSSGFHFGCACSTSAATPATCGEAIDVPDSDSCKLPLPRSVEMIGLPGAEISGFRLLSPLRGPPELNDASARRSRRCLRRSRSPGRRAARAAQPSDVAVVGQARHAEERDRHVVIDRRRRDSGSDRPSYGGSAVRC